MASISAVRHPCQVLVGERAPGAVSRDCFCASAATDAEGVARITDLPPEPDLFFGARSAACRLRQADRDNVPTAAIVSGGVTRRELVLERQPI